MHRKLTYILLLPMVLTLGCGAAEDRPNILLITLDTTRMDRLGVYGYDGHTSANIDALARESVVYTKAVSTSSWTLPAHASLFTGRFTASHGARYDPEGPMMLTNAIPGPEGWDRYRARGLSSSTVTLAEILHDAGFATGAVVGGPWLKAVFGLNRGFDTYDENNITTVNGRPASDVTDAALSWIDQNKERQQFLFLNYFDPHGPYTPPKEFAQRHVMREMLSDPSLADLVDRRMYDAEIDYMDHHVGRVLDRLKEMGLYEKTWIIVTADHGELLGEHGKWGHGHYLTEHELRIPLIVKYPFAEETSRRDSTRVSLVDILPVVVTRLGIEPPADIQGAKDFRHPMVAEVYPLPTPSGEGSWRVLYEDPHKCLWNSLGGHGLYNIEQDPNEDADLSSRLNDRAATMSQTLTQYLESLPPPGPSDEKPVQVDDETQEQLRSLGYTN